MSALLLADARLPVGGHAHSGGIEQAVDEGNVHDLSSLEAFVTGRLLSAGTIEAHAASRSCALLAESPGAVVEQVAELDAELDARFPSPVARATSRAQGSSFLAVSTRVLCSSELERIAAATRRDPHLAVSIGLAAGAARLSPTAAASICCYHSISSSASAGLRLLGLDPVEVATSIARMTEIAETIATIAATSTGALPASSSPLLDFLLERHDQRTERLFAS